MERVSMSHPDLRALASMQAPRPSVLRSAALEMSPGPGKGKASLSPGRGGGGPGGLPTRAPGAPGGPGGPLGATRRLALVRLVGLGLGVVCLALLAVSWARPGPALGSGSGVPGAPAPPAWAQHLPGSAWPPPSAGGGGPSDLHTPVGGPHLTGLAALCGVADGDDLAGRGGGGGGSGLRAGATPAPAPYTHRGLAPCLSPDPASSDPGARVGQPTVALLFLSAGDLAHAPTWRAWLAGAAGALRADCVAADVCAAHPPRRPDEAPAAGAAGMGGIDPPPPPGRRRLAGGSSAVAAARAAEVARLSSAVAAARAGAAGGGGASSLPHPAGQALFTVYVHTPPNVTLPATSPFAGREIEDRVATAWGSHSIVEATRRLLAAALADPRNQRFVLLSETCAPLYPAAATYAQLMAEPKSRVNACAPAAGVDVGIHRFSPRMERGALRKAAWRKSSQWVTLTRPHAARLAADTDIAATFAEFCVNGYDPDLGAPRYCHSDEHYIPSALAAWGLEGETDCVGGGTAVDWSGGGSHPASYWHHDISGDLVERLRAADDACEPEAAMDAARAVFVRPDQLAPGVPAGCGWARPRRPGAPAPADTPPHLRGVPTALSVLGPKCTLFARKFVPEAAERLLGLVQGDPGLRLLEAPQPSCSG